MHFRRFLPEMRCLSPVCPSEHCSAARPQVPPALPPNSVILPVEPQARGNFHERGPSHWCGNPQAAGTPEAELAHKCLYYMLLMREVEDRIERKLYRQGKIAGRRLRGPRAGSHPGGQRPGRRSPTTCSVPPIATWPSSSSAASRRAASSRSTWAAMGGLTRGRDGNMHMGDMSAGIVSIISALAATVPGGHRRRAGAALPGHATAWPSATSATAPPAAATGTKASTSPACRSCRWSTSATTISTPIPRP